MRVGLFILPYVDAFFPEVGVATLEIFSERFGVDVFVSARSNLLRAADGEQRLPGRRGAGVETLFVEEFSRNSTLSSRHPAVAPIMCVLAF